jgi:hypothetical protein
MRRILSRRPSPAMVVACLALLVALGGTSVAAVNQLGRNTVGPRQLQFGAVTAPKIRNNAVTSIKVRNRSLLRADFAPGQLPAGPTGPQGPAGPAGAAGPAGPAGAIGAITVRTNSVSVVSTAGDAHNAFYATQRVQRLCETNERAISAGTSWSDDAINLELWTGEIDPILNAQNQVIGYDAVGGNHSGQTRTFTLEVLCYVP